MLPKTQQFYNEKLRSKYGDAKGATVDNLVEMERKLDLKLPLSLKAYLLWGGNHSDGPLIGTDCFASDILGNTEYFREFLDENSITNPRGDDVIVFYSHQGYVLAWIYASDGDNPEVYYFAEGTTQAIAKETTIDEWFYKDLSGLHGGSY
ncbi:SMI1/KNR4 family protein [Marinagarivorans algicola]|uniref:SMI1/KNR4 family protein n=1 Tax=Marinagarivorans algicola TaxID=1513270 RepID=UPI003736981F